MEGMDVSETYCPINPSIVDKLADICANLKIPSDHGRCKSTFQSEIEQKIRGEVKILKQLKDDLSKLEKEYRTKQDNVNQYVKSCSQYETRISRTKEKYEEKVKSEARKKALISSVIEHLKTIIGLDLEVIKLEEDSAETLKGTYKIILSRIDPKNPDKTFNITIESGLQEIKILETDILELDYDLMKVETQINNKLNSGQINFIGFLVKCRKMIMDHLGSKK